MSELSYNMNAGYRAQSESAGTSLALAALVHLVLLAFLWVGVQWQSKQTTAVEAEVWDMTTRQAAPLPVPVEPVEVEPVEPVKVIPQEIIEEEPDIAIELEKKRQLREKEKLAAIELAQRKAKEKEQEKLAEAKLKKEKQVQDALDKKQLAKEKAASDKIYEENMRRMNAQVQKTAVGGTGDAAKSTGNNRGDPSYGALIGAKVKSNTAYAVSDGVSNNPTVEFLINLFPDGSLRGPVKKTKSSGVPAFDSAVEKAIEKSQPFPRDKSGEVPSSFTLVHRMKD